MARAGAPIVPKVWDEQELVSHAQRSMDIFIARRLAEPETRYRTLVGEAMQSVQALLHELKAIDPRKPDLATVRRIMASKRLNAALRYVAGPPISSDDLGVLVTRRMSRMTGRALRADGETTANVLGLVCRLADPVRFPWLREQRRPRLHELKWAIRSTAVLLAAQGMQTERRAFGREVEHVLRERLLIGGFEKVAAPGGGRIESPSEMPRPMRFYGECGIHGRRTDLLIGLSDGRHVAVEAKDSSSVVNSVKRVLNDTAAKARFWKDKFGETLVPVALLSGVFAPDNLRAAQRSGLFLVFAHDLDDFVTWLGSPRR